MASWGTIEGANVVQASGVSSVSLTITASAGDIIVVCSASEFAAGTAYQVSNVTDNGSAGLSFTRRTLTQLTSGSNSFGQDNEVWWAYSANALSSESVKITYGGNVDACCVGIFGVPGANTTTPFDINSHVPASLTNTTYNSGTPPNTTFSTSNANALAFAFFGSPGPPSESGPCAYPVTKVQSGSTEFIELQNTSAIAAQTIELIYEFFSSTQSSTSFGWSDTTLACDWVLIVDAIQKAGGGSFAPLSRRTFGPRIGDRQAIGW